MLVLLFGYALIYSTQACVYARTYSVVQCNPLRSFPIPEPSSGLACSAPEICARRAVFRIGLEVLIVALL